MFYPNNFNQKPASLSHFSTFFHIEANKYENVLTMLVSDFIILFYFIFTSLQSKLCVCMMSHSDNRVITVSHLIPSHP